MMRRIKVIPPLLATVFFLSCMLIAIPVSAVNDIQRVYDNAGLLSDDEIDKLEQQAEKYSAKRDINYLIVTTDNPEELLENDSDNTEARTERYSKAFYKSFVETYGQEEANCTILTIDMSNRYVDVSGQEIAETKLNNERCTQLSEKIAPYLSTGDYYKACSKYIKTVNNYVGVKVGIDPEFILLKTWFQLLIGLVVASVTVGIMVANSGGRVTVNQGTYLDQKDSRILAKRDLYVRTTTTKIRKPQTNSGSGGSHGGGGGGGGGGSHGGSHF
jgi:uncharacterized protein